MRTVDADLKTVQRDLILLSAQHSETRQMLSEILSEVKRTAEVASQNTQETRNLRSIRSMLIAGGSGIGGGVAVGLFSLCQHYLSP